MPKPNIGHRYPMSLRLRMWLICVAITLIAGCGVYAGLLPGQSHYVLASSMAFVGMVIAIVSGVWPGPGWSDEELDRAEQRLAEKEPAPDYKPDDDQLREARRQEWERYGEL